ncbi:MAG: M48 family peptidase, partial [Candidatus Omnitrophota bacterium]|nr:M48 family peptidase [Candidatus Omnitrophota bacterium]
MNIYLTVILAILIGEYLLDLVVENLNIRGASPVLPKEFEGYYAPEKYGKSQDYLKETTNFGLAKNTFFMFLIVIFILIGGFNYIDRLARSFNQGSIVTGLFFAGIMLLAAQLLAIPFSAYRT